MKKIFLALTILFFVACSDSDENMGATTGDFVGTWNLTAFEVESSSKVSFGGIGYTVEGTTYGKDFDFTFTFSEDPNEYTTNGSYTAVTEYEVPLEGTESFEYPVTASESFSSGTWSIVDNKLIIENGLELQDLDLDISETGFETDLTGITVKSITSNKIVLEEKISEDFSQTYDGEEYSYEIDVTYTVVLEK